LLFEKRAEVANKSQHRSFCKHCYRSKWATQLFKLV